MKKIRANIVVELPYSNELLNYGDKLNEKIKQVIADTKFVQCKITAGTNFEDNSIPVIKETV
tara:strand:- start:75 stop:260 length:186 start_codon:yes stop_codon:yes gene_type:complete